MSSALTGRIALLFVIVFASFASHAQTSRLGRFSVDQTRGCAPFTVTITSTNLIAPFSCPTCLMIFEPTFSQQNTYTYTYLKPGTYKLGVNYQSVLINPTDDIIITVDPNIKPEFEIYACANNGAVVNITDTNYDKYTVDYGDGTPVLTNVDRGTLPGHTYAASATYNISIHGHNNPGADNCDAMVKPFQALAVLPAPIINTLTDIDAGDIKLDFSAADNLKLRPEISINDAVTFQFMADIYGVSTTNVSSVKVDDNFYCFRLNTHDACSGADTPSEIICSHKFSATAASDVDHLVWNIAGSVANTNISRNGAALSSTTSLAFDDTDILCNTQYCYQLVSLYGNGSQSISLTKCVTAITARIPSAIDNVSAVVGADGASLAWVQDPSFVPKLYHILKKTPGFEYTEIGTSTVPQYIDASYSTDAKVSYRIKYQDQCLNDSPLGIQVVPIRLTGILEKSNFAQLHWSSYRGWKDGVANYTVNRLDEQGAILNNFTVSDTSFHDVVVDTVNQNIAYTVTANPVEATITTSISNEIDFHKTINLYAPTAFTPDRNNVNDRFRVRGFFIRSLEVHIYNRWGNIVYSTSIENAAWDGTYSGKLMPNDTYVWHAKVIDFSGKETTHTGMVLLLTQ